jgi:integrase/recombinase XerD
VRLSEAIEALAIATAVDGRAERTVQGYREKLATLLDFLGDVDVATVTLDQLRAFVASLMGERTLWPGDAHKARRGRLSPYSVMGYVRHVKRLFSWLTAEGHLQSNPAARLRVPKPRERHVKAIAPDDLLALLRTTEGDTAIDRRDRALILLLVDTGARAGGVCGLRLGDLDLDALTARVTEKGGRTRTVYYSALTAAALRAWLEVRPADRGEWLFTGLRERDAERVTPNGLRTMLARRARRAGVTGRCNPHSFRHGFAVAYLMDGGDLASLSALLGHSGITVTADYYARFTPDQLQQKHAAHSPVLRMLGGGNGHD